MRSIAALDRRESLTGTAPAVGTGARKQSEVGRIVQATGIGEIADRGGGACASACARPPKRADRHARHPLLSPVLEVRRLTGVDGLVA